MAETAEAEPAEGGHPRSIDRMLAVPASYAVLVLILVVGAIIGIVRLV
jgi:hypothetical protein